MRQAPVEVIFIRRRNLGTVGCDQLRPHALQGDGLIAVVGDYKENREIADLVVVDGKNSGLVGHIIGIEGDYDFFVSMRIVRRVGYCWFRRRHDKILSRPGEQGKNCGYHEPERDAAEHGHEL